MGVGCIGGGGGGSTSAGPRVGKMRRGADKREAVSDFCLMEARSGPPPSPLAALTCHLPTHERQQLFPLWRVLPSPGNRIPWSTGRDTEAARATAISMVTRSTPPLGRLAFLPATANQSGGSRLSPPARNAVRFDPALASLSAVSQMLWNVSLPRQLDFACIPYRCS